MRASLPMPDSLPMQESVYECEGQSTHARASPSEGQSTQVKASERHPCESQEGQSTHARASLTKQGPGLYPCEGQPTHAWAHQDQCIQSIQARASLSMGNLSMRGSVNHD
jgi:hypothetical protein